MFHKRVFLKLVSWMEHLFYSSWFATTWHGGHVGGAIEVISQGERVQGWRSDESTRLLPMWPGFKSRRWRHMRVEFAVGSLPCSERFFSRYSSFALSSKTNISKFQFDQESGRRRTTMWMRYLQIVIYLFIYLFTWKTGDSKCLEVGGQLWKSRQLWQLTGCKAPEARGVWVASYLKSSSQWNSSSHRLVLKPLWKWSLVPREQKWFCS